MAAGDPFTVVPNTVITLVPEYNNVQSQTESMKKEYFNLSGTPVEKYKLEFKVNSDAERDVILTHYKDQLGGHHDFSWQSVPSYIGAGANITGRWITGSLQMEPISNKWKVMIDFEKEN